MIIIIIIAFTIITSSSSSSSSSIISSGWDVVGPHAPPGLPPRTWGAHEQHSLTSSGQELQKARGGPLVAPSALAASAVPKPPAKTSEKALAKQVEFVFGNPGGLCRPEIVSRWLWIEIKAPETGFAKLRPGTQRHACCVLKLRSSCTYSVCVCVCPTLDKGFSTTILPQAGGQRMTSRRWPTKLVMSWDAVRDV